MVNTRTGAVTHLQCSILDYGARRGCYWSSGQGIGAIAELRYTKSDAGTYWNPGLGQNLQWFLYNDPVYGWKPIVAYVLALDNTYLQTIYYYSIPPDSGGEPLFQNVRDNRIGWLSTGAFDDSCQPFPGENPLGSDWTSDYVDGGYQYKRGPWTWLMGRWSTVLNTNDWIPCDGIVDYCGPAFSLTQREGAYDFFAVETDEKWWFSMDPSGMQPPMLKVVRQTVFDGVADNVTIESIATQIER